MKRLYTLLLLTGLWSAASAQQGGQSFTLEQCITYALENSATNKNSLIDQEIAEARVKETRGIGLPQVNGAVALTHNQKLPRFFGQYRTPDGQGVSFFPATPGVNDGDVMAQENFFQLKSSGDVGVKINQMLFNGSYFVGLKAANAYRDLSIKNTNQTREQTIVQVSKAYYSVLINRARMQLFDDNIGRVDSLLRSTTAMNKSGFSESIDVDRIQVQLNNLVTERDKFYAQQELSLYLLKFQMNYSMDQPIEIVGDLTTLQVDENVLNQYSAEWDYTIRPDYKVLEANRKMQALDLRNKYAAGMPTLNGFVNLGYSTQSNSVGGLFKTETNSNAEFAPGFGPDKWYSYSQFGVNLNIPLFSGLQRNYQVQQSRLALQKIENNMVQLKQTADLEAKQSAIVYMNAVRSLKSQQQNQGLAERVARVTKIKYEQGVGSNIEVVDAENSLKQAQTNYYSALYDALVAKVDLDKAYGKFTTQPTQTK
jgi:outer membrane protein TolC